MTEEERKKQKEEDRSRLIAMLESSGRGQRGRQSAARVQRNRVRDAKEAEWGKYEAQNKAGIDRSEANRARHMELVLGPDWKKQADDGRSIREELRKGDARRRALDPDNDPEMFSSLRNKLNINPTNAEVERRLMARGNAGREMSRLSEGEAEGALAGSAAERIREAKMRREAAEKDKDFQRKRHEDYQKFRSGKGALEVAREPTTGGLEELGTESLRERVNKDARVKDYKGFTDEAALLARERARRGESPIEQGEGSEEALRGALPFARAAERKKYGGVGESMLEERHKREKGLMNMGSLPPSERAKLESEEAEGERMSFDDPSIAGRGSWRGKEEELGGKSMPFTEAMKEEIGGKSLNLNEKENRDLLRKIDPEKAASLEQGDIDKQMTEGMAQDEVERAVNEEFTQDQARDAISTLDPEEADEVAKEVAKTNGPMSEEHIEVKEAMRDKDGKQRYVRYEGSGLVINMSMLEKDIKRNENMAMLKHIPAANRPAMLVEWGYIDPGDLSTMQKKSAKQLKEESLLDLKIANAEIQKEKLTRTLGPKEKIAYDAAHKGMLDAAKNGKYGLADMYRKKINELNPDSDTTDYEELFEKGIQRNKKLTPQKLFTAAGLPDGKPYWKSRLDISKAISLYKGASKAKKTEAFQNIIGGTVESGPNAGENYGTLLKAHGIYEWEKIKGTKPEGVPPFAMKDEEAYMNWALPAIKNSLLKGIWGNMHTQLESMQAIESEKIKKKLSDQFVPKSSVAPDNVKEAENKRKDKVKSQRTNLDNKLEGLNWYRTEGGPKQRKNVPLTKAEMYERAMKEGGEEMTKKFLSKTVGGRKAAKFKSLEEAVKYFKDPKNAKELEKESPSFQHFISKK
jgi:hypothetical protein